MIKDVSRILALFTVLSFGCGGEDPISVSSPIGINLKAEDGDVKENNVISIDKGITTESGNPWGAFIDDVDDKLGVASADIELEELELALGASSEGVTALNEVFDGLVEVQFEMNDTRNFFTVGTVNISSETDGRTVRLDPSFDLRDYQAIDREKLLGGSFKVVLAASAEAEFKALKAKAELQLTFTFAAYE